MKRRGVIGRVFAGLAVAAVALGGGNATAAPTTTETDRATTASVPWWKVGPGWSAVTRTSTGHPHSPLDLYLISPGGTAYRTATLPSGTELQDIAPDGKRVTFMSPSDDGVWGCRLFSIPTGRTYTVSTSKSGCHARFTRPSGKQLLVTEGKVINKRTLGGTHVRRVFTGGSIGTVVETPGGTAVAAAVDGRVRLVRQSDGTVIRTMSRAPGGLEWCEPRRWWSTSVLVVHCTEGEGDAWSRHRVFRWDTRQSTIGQEIRAARRQTTSRDLAVNAWYRGGPYFESFPDATDGTTVLYRTDVGDLRWGGRYSLLRPVTIVGARAYGVSMGNREGETYAIRNIPERRTIVALPRSGSKQITGAVVIDPND